MRAPEDWHPLWTLWGHMPAAQCEQLWTALPPADQQQSAYRLETRCNRRPKSPGRALAIGQLFGVVTPHSLITALEVAVQEHLLAGIGPDGEWR